MEYEVLLEEFSGLIPLDDLRLCAVDWAPYLGVVKWDPPVPPELVGQVKGHIPSWIKKTDQERCQNLVKEIFEDNVDSLYEVSLKLDGTSVTYYHRDGEIGVCSRNLEYKINDVNQGNTMIRILFDSKLADILSSFGNIAIQGELMGPGIQGNREKLKKHKFFIFDMQNLNTGTYYDAPARQAVMQIINELCEGDLISEAQVYFARQTLQDLGIVDVQSLLDYAVGQSINHPVREGLVFKRVDGGFSFKAISNKFLLKSED